MNQSISISPMVHSKMMNHAVRNPRSVVHGILLGKSDANDITAVDVLPVCHSPPTKPLLDMSLRLAEAYCLSNEDDNNLEIIGWYTAPEKNVDESPGAAALKIVSSIASTSESNDKHPILICITNKDMENFFKVGNLSDSDRRGFSIYGRDEGSQWKSEYSIDSIQSSMGSWSSSNQIAVGACLDKELTCFDFENHLDGGTDGCKEIDWIRNVNVNKYVSQRLSDQ